MADGSAGTRTVGNLIWRFMERCGAQVVTLVVSIVLARLLDPTVYGTVALVTVFITILQVFVDSGLGSALIQKKNADDLDFSTVFYFNIGMCLVLYAIMFCLAPVIAHFYDTPSLTPVIRVLSLTLVFSGIKNVQQAYVSKKMQFKRFFYSTIGGTIGAAIVGIFMAYKGYGVWALVGQNLFNVIVSTVILWITVKWRPIFAFSWKRLKGLFSYGWKILVSALINTGYTELNSLIIGKKYSADDLAYYQRGHQFPSPIVTTINSSIDSVLLPTMSEVQDKQERVKAMTRRAIRISSYIMCPIMVGLGVCAEPIVRLLLTDKWLPCVFFLRIFCFTFALYPIHTANLNALKAMGRSDMFLKLEIIKKVVGIAAILATMWISVEAMAYSYLATSILSTVINAFPNKKLLNYSWAEQMKDILPSVALSAVMGIPVFFMNYLSWHLLIVLAMQVVSGALIYVALSAILRVESFKYLLDITKKMFKRERKEVKKILLLGGSAQQVVAVETAKRLGYYTVLCDYLSDNPGQHVADKFYLVSTTDKEAILEVAKKEGVSGVLAYASDPAAPTAAYVAETLNLHGNPYLSVETLCNKDKFREFLRENGFNVPKSCGYATADEAYADIDKYDYPIIIKPIDSSGSKGVTVLSSADGSKAAIDFAFSFSRSHRIIIEEFIEKDHDYLIGGDIFVTDGRVTQWGLMNCHRDACVNSLVPVGKSYPVRLADDVLNEVKETLQELVDKLGIKSGPMNVELIVDKHRRVFLIDVGPRSGGNMIPDLLSMIFGVNVVEMCVNTAMGVKLSAEETQGEPYYATHNVHSAKTGTLLGIEFSDELKKYIVRESLYKKSGDAVEYFDNAAKALGIIFMKFDFEETMNAILADINSHVRVTVSEGEGQ